MKNKIVIIAVLCLSALLAYFGCGRRATPLDPYLPDPDCGKLGYFSHNYTHYHYGNYIYACVEEPDKDRTITSISINVNASTDAVVMIYSVNGSSSGNLLAQSQVAAVREGWNTIDIPDTVLYAGTQYRFAVQTRNLGDVGIRSEQDKGNMYTIGNTWGTVPSSVPLGSISFYMLLIYGNYCGETPPTATPYISSATPTQTINTSWTKTATPTITVTPTTTSTATNTSTALPGCAGSGVFGKSTGTSSGSFSDSGKIFYSQYSLAENGILKDIGLLTGGSSGNVRVAVYDASRNLVSDSGPFFASAGWNSIDVPDAMLPAGDYYLAVHTSGIQISSGSGNMDQCSNTWGSMPSVLPASTGFYSGTCIFIYAAYCPFAGNSPTVTITPTLIHTMTHTATATRTVTQQPTPTNTMQATQGPTCVSPLHYGMDSGTPRPDYWSGSYIWVMDYNLSIAGRLDSITAQFQLAGGQAMAALYDSSGNKLTESAVTPTSAGWVTMPVVQIVLATGMYKLAIQANGGNLLALNLNSMTAYSNIFGSMPAVLPAVNHTQGTISILAYGNICP